MGVPPAALRVRLQNALMPGDPAPAFVARASNNPAFSFDSAAGRYLVLFLYGSAAVPQVREALDGYMRHGAIFNDARASFFGVSADPEDERSGRVMQCLPGYRHFWDFDLAVSRLYGCVGAARSRGGHSYSPHSVVIDPGLRVVAVLPLSDPATHVSAVLGILAAQPAVAAPAPAAAQAPVLVVPSVLEPALCEELVRLYDSTGGRESGFMRDVDGRTVEIREPQHKQRRDCPILDPDMRRELRGRFIRRLLPAVHKAFSYRATYIERYIVGCYDAERGGHFRPHRDNTTKGTIHRAFAVSLNVGPEDYDGCDLRFPEFGWQEYRPPLGGAVVFSCSLLHEVTPIRRGRRLVLLPFLYDDAAAALRAENRSYVDLIGKG
ncbi:MAG: 2OG-Fe(II) oxygenase [Alphaproteobacteria bacterium]